MSERSTYRALLRKAEGALREASVPEPEADARALLSACFSLSMADYLLKADEPADEAAADRFEEWLRRRAAREPLQYITGCAWFDGEPFLVTPDVLIPRQDTEVLTAEVMRHYPPEAHAGRVLDLCTGSGCILLTLLKHSCFAEGVGTDISPAALAVAKRNAERLGVNARFAEGDLYGAVPGERFTVITANPPYVTEEEYQSLDEEVLREPKLALTAPHEGLSFYERITAGAKDHLLPGGRIFFEIGCTQRESVFRLLADAGFTEITCAKDPSGLDRVLSARKEEA